jgi:TolB-like protein/Tfp pilus assembly protein PilF
MAELKLRLLGEFELEGASRPRLSTRKAEALLAYLALSAGQAHGRDKLAGILWGGKDERKAHHNLAQALHVIRGALKSNGDDPLIADGGTVALDPAGIEVDAAAFERLAGQRTAEALTAAVDLYRGDLLDGIDIREAAFEDWLRGEQGRLRTLALNALDGLLRHQMAADDHLTAIDTANRLLALDPIREATHRTLMRMYCRLERQEAAIRQYQSCAEILQRDLNIVPGEKTTALYEEILGERAKTPVREPAVMPSIAVLPFENLSDDPGQEYFAEGIAEDLITALSRFRSLFVIARTSTFTYQGRATDITRMAGELDVRYVVEGSVRKAGNRLRITAQLIDATSGNHLWANHFDGALDDVFDLQDQITEQIVAGVEPEIEAHERERARRKPPESLDAWALVQRGLSHFYRPNKADRLEAIRLFSEAVALDPEFAAAHAQLALALWASVHFGHAEDSANAVAAARASAKKAVSLDPNEPLGHIALGRMHTLDGEIEMAIGEMQAAIALNPNFARAHYGLGYIYQTGAGQAEQALPHLDAALRLSPRSPTRWLTLMLKGGALRVLGRHDEAIAYGRQACQFPDSGYLPCTYLVAALAEAGQMGEAQAALEKAMRLEPALSLGFVRNNLIGMHETAWKSLRKSLRKAGVPE